MIQLQPCKIHFLCPNIQCGCAISCDLETFHSDFAEERPHTYRYYGAVKAEDNLSCKYCQRQMIRGDMVEHLRLIPPGPVYRKPEL